MAEKEYKIGSQGPFKYDDAAFPAALDTDGTIRAATTPVAGADVVRLDDVGGGGAVAPSDAEYVVVSLDGDLSAERVLAVNATNLSLVDGGVNDNITLDTIQNVDVTATPEFVGMTLSGLDVGHIPYVAAGGVIATDSGQLFWDAANNRLGIGTGSPDSIFHIKANVAGTVGSHPAGQLIIQDPDDTVFGNAVITGYESDGAGNPDQQLWYLGSSSSSNSNIIFLNRRNSKLQLGTNDVSRLTILGDGNVGIGIAAPLKTLHVYNALGFNTQFRLERSGQGHYDLSMTGERLAFVDQDGQITVYFPNSGNIAGFTEFVFNEGGADLDFRIESDTNTHALFVQGSDGNVGIGTDVLGAKLAIAGIDANDITGPHIQITTDADDYPLLHMVNRSHDDIRWYFDAYIGGGGAIESSDAGSNLLISKDSDLLKFQYGSGIAQGDPITWNEGWVMDLSTGYVGIGITPTTLVHLYGDAPILTLQDDGTTGTQKTGIQFGSVGDIDSAGIWHDRNVEGLNFATGGSGITDRDMILGNGGALYLSEIAAAGADIVAYGQLWIKNTTPCELWFTDDAGGDHQIAYA